MLSFVVAVCSVPVATMCLQIAKLVELAQVALGGGSDETEMSDNLFGGDFIFIGHILQNIGQFLCQKMVLSTIYGVIGSGSRSERATELLMMESKEIF